MARADWPRVSGSTVGGCFLGIWRRAKRGGPVEFVWTAHLLILILWCAIFAELLSLKLGSLVYEVRFGNMSRNRGRLAPERGALLLA